MDINHALDVASRVDGEDAKKVAMLHDVVEDDGVSYSRLMKAGFSQEIVIAVEAITRRENESYKDYIRRVAKNDLAKQVKIADLRANLDRIDDGYWSEDQRSTMNARYRWALVYLREVGR